MKHAQIAVIDESGRAIWDGSLYRFAKDNGYDRTELAALIVELTTLNEGRPQAATIGGGAAPLFYVSLLA